MPIKKRDVLKAYGSFENIFPKLVVICIEKIERERWIPLTRNEWWVLLKVKVINHNDKLVYKKDTLRDMEMV